MPLRALTDITGQLCWGGARQAFPGVVCPRHRWGPPVLRERPISVAEELVPVGQEARAWARRGGRPCGHQSSLPQPRNAVKSRPHARCW